MNSCTCLGHDLLYGFHGSLGAKKRAPLIVQLPYIANPAMETWKLSCPTTQPFVLKNPQDPDMAYLVRLLGMDCTAEVGKGNPYCSANIERANSLHTRDPYGPTDPPT